MRKGFAVIERLTADSCSSTLPPGQINLDKYENDRDPAYQGRIFDSSARKAAEELLIPVSATSEPQQELVDLWKYLESEDAYFERMRRREGLEVTPVDIMTRLPLPVVALRGTDLRGAEEGDKVDRNHAFHPYTRTRALGIAGEGLRGCRVQILGRTLHESAYHKVFAGPRLPEKPEDMFRAVVFAAAGYIPEEGIAFSSDQSPSIVEVSPQMRNELWRRNFIGIDSKARVKKFLEAYLLLQDVSEVVSTVTVEEFLATEDEKRKWELGHILLGGAARLATDSIKEDFKEAKRLQLVPEEQLQIRSAARFVLGVFGMKKQRVRAIMSMHSRLKAEMIGASLGS